MLKPIGEILMGGRLSLVAGPTLIKEVPSRLAEFGENRTQGFQAGQDAGIVSRDGTQLLGSAAMLPRGLTELVRLYLKVFCHVGLLSFRGLH
jgi:hypothetical protein